MWELDYEESWAPKNWCFWTVMLEKTLESPLDYKEIQPVHPKGDQSWVFTGRTDVEAETPILWPPDPKSWLIGKDPDAGRDWGQEEKGTTEDEMAGWHHRLDWHEFGWTPGVGDGQGGLACCDSWGCKESDTTERLNWTELRRGKLNWTEKRQTERAANCGCFSTIHPSLSGDSILLCLYCCPIIPSNQYPHLPDLPPQKWACKPRMRHPPTHSDWSRMGTWPRVDQSEIFLKIFFTDAFLWERKALMMARRHTFFVSLSDFVFVHSQWNQSWLAQSHSKKRKTCDGKNMVQQIQKKDMSTLPFQPIILTILPWYVDPAILTLFLVLYSARIRAVSMGPTKQ